MEKAKYNFKPREGRINFRQLLRLDMPSIIAQGEPQKLQSLLDNIVFAEFTKEDVQNIDDDALFALVQYLQHTLEYVLFAQDRLSHSVTLLDDERRSLKEKLEKKKRECLELQKSNVKLKSEQRQRHSELQPKSASLVDLDTIKAPAAIYRCTDCKKAFRTVEFLKKHILVSHLENSSNGPTPAIVFGGVNGENSAPQLEDQHKTSSTPELKLNEKAEYSIPQKYIDEILSRLYSTSSSVEIKDSSSTRQDHKLDEQIALLKAENYHLREELSEMLSMKDAEITRLHEENLRLISQLHVEMKSLESKLISGLLSTNGQLTTKPTDTKAENLPVRISTEMDPFSSTVSLPWSSTLISPSFQLGYMWQRLPESPINVVELDPRKGRYPTIKNSSDFNLMPISIREEWGDVLPEGTEISATVPPRVRIPEKWSLEFSVPTSPRFRFMISLCRAEFISSHPSLITDIAAQLALFPLIANLGKKSSSNGGILTCEDYLPLVNELEVVMPLPEVVTVTVRRRMCLSEIIQELSSQLMLTESTVSLSIPLSNAAAETSSSNFAMKQLVIVDRMSSPTSQQQSEEDSINTFQDDENRPEILDSRLTVEEAKLFFHRPIVSITASSIMGAMEYAAQLQEEDIASPSALVNRTEVEENILSQSFIQHNNVDESNISELPVSNTFAHSLELSVDTRAAIELDPMESGASALTEGYSLFSPNSVTAFRANDSAVSALSHPSEITSPNTSIASPAGFPVLLENGPVAYDKTASQDVHNLSEPVPSGEVVINQSSTQKEVSNLENSAADIVSLEKAEEIAVEKEEEGVAEEDSNSSFSDNSPPSLNASSGSHDLRVDFIVNTVRRNLAEVVERFISPQLSLPHRNAQITSQSSQTLSDTWHSRATSRSLGSLEDPQQDAGSNGSPSSRFVHFPPREHQRRLSEREFRFSASQANLLNGLEEGEVAETQLASEMPQASEDSPSPPINNNNNDSNRENELEGAFSVEVQDDLALVMDDDNQTITPSPHDSTLNDSVLLAADALEAEVALTELNNVEVDANLKEDGSVDSETTNLPSPD